MLDDAVPCGVVLVAPVARRPPLHVVRHDPAGELVEVAQGVAVTDFDRRARHDELRLHWASRLTLTADLGTPFSTISSASMCASSRLSEATCQLHPAMDGMRHVMRGVGSKRAENSAHHSAPCLVAKTTHSLTQTPQSFSGVSAAAAEGGANSSSWTILTSPLRPDRRFLRIRGTGYRRRRGTARCHRGVFRRSRSCQARTPRMLYRGWNRSAQNTAARVYPDLQVLGCRSTRALRRATGGRGGPAGRATGSSARACGGLRRRGSVSGRWPSSPNPARTPGPSGRSPGSGTGWWDAVRGAARPGAWRAAGAARGRRYGRRTRGRWSRCAGRSPDPGPRRRPGGP